MEHAPLSHDGKPRTFSSERSLPVYGAAQRALCREEGWPIPTGPGAADGGRESSKLRRRAMMYPFVVSKVWGWRQMVKNLRELGAKQDAGSQLMMETSAKIYERCADELIRAFQEKTMEVQTLLGKFGYGGGDRRYHG
jgi:hypothetical protein